MDFDILQIGPTIKEGRNGDTVGFPFFETPPEVVEEKIVKMTCPPITLNLFGSSLIVWAKVGEKILGIRNSSKLMM
jgi:hypothetical protein